MTRVQGNLKVVTGVTDGVTEVWVRAARSRAVDGGWLMTAADRQPVLNGAVDLELLPGACVLVAVTAGEPGETVELIVPETGTASLEACIRAAEAAGDLERNALDELRQDFGAWVDEVRASLGSAASSASAARSSANAAKTNAGRAATSATNASKSATAAAGSASAADKSRSDASAFANSAKTASESASASAQQAAGSMDAASAEASGAAISASTAASSAKTAKADADRAQVSADTAEASATTAASSAGNAEAYAFQAANVASSTSWTGDRLTVNGQTSPPLTGPSGEKGATGPRGDRGPEGPPGPAGKDGEVTFAALSEAEKLSLKGEPGPQGPAGPTGARGATGKTGPAGPAGPTGPQGPEGPSGPQGPPGEPGAGGARGVAVQGSGADPLAEGAKSLAVGWETYGKGTSSTAIGYAANAEGDSSTAIGSYSKASAEGATAIGTSSQANADCATAIGPGHRVTAPGETHIGVPKFFLKPLGVSSRVVLHGTAEATEPASAPEHLVSKGYVDEKLESLESGGGGGSLPSFEELDVDLVSGNYKEKLSALSQGVNVVLSFSTADPFLAAWKSGDATTITVRIKGSKLEEELEDRAIAGGSMCGWSFDGKSILAAMTEAEEPTSEEEQRALFERAASPKFKVFHGEFVDGDLRFEIPEGFTPPMGAANIIFM